MEGLSDGEFVAWLAASCERSAVTLKVTDRLVVRSVVVLLTGTAGSAGREPPALPDGSDAPDEINPAGIETAGGGLAGSDVGVVEDRFDDRGLTAEGEVGPLSA